MMTSSYTGPGNSQTELLFPNKGKEMDFVQTRSEENGLRYFASVKEAMLHAETDSSIWKISFQTQNREQIRLVRDESNQWKYEPITL